MAGTQIVYKMGKTGEEYARCWQFLDYLPEMWNNAKKAMRPNIKQRDWLMSASDVVTGKAATGAAVVGAVLGLTLSEWAALATLVFVLLQILVISPKAIAQAKEYYLLIKAWVRRHRHPNEH